MNRNLRAGDLMFNPDSLLAPEYPANPDLGFVYKSITGSTRYWDGYHTWLTHQILPFTVGGMHSLLIRIPDLTCDGGGDFEPGDQGKASLKTPFPVVINVTGIGFMPATDIADTINYLQIAVSSSPASNDSAVYATLEAPIQRNDASGNLLNGNRTASRYFAGKYYTVPLSMARQFSGGSTGASGIEVPNKPPAGSFPMGRSDMTTVKIGTSPGDEEVSRASMPAQGRVRCVGKFENVDTKDLPNTPISTQTDFCINIENAPNNQVFSIFDIFGTVKVSV